MSKKSQARRVTAAAARRVVRIARSQLRATVRDVAERHYAATLELARAKFQGDSIGILLAQRACWTALDSIPDGSERAFDAIFAARREREMAAVRREFPHWRAGAVEREARARRYQGRVQ